MEHLKKSNDIQSEQHLSHPLVIKMGGRQWVVGGDNASPMEVRNTEKLISLNSWTAGNPIQVESIPVEHKHGLSKWVARCVEKLSVNLDGLLGRRKLRDTFQYGITLGLIMGCISIFLFHQLEPNHHYTSGPSSNQTATVLTGLSPGFTLPSVKLYTLQSSPFSSEKEAVKVQSELNKRGIFTVVRGNQTYTLWCSMAIHPGALKSVKDHLAKAGLKVTEVSVAWNAQSIAGPSGESQSTADKVSRWLSASVSSLTTLTGVLSDGGVAKDATQAYLTEKSLRPTADVLASTGYQKELNELVQDMDAAKAAYQKNSRDNAMGNIIRAYVALSNIQMSANSFS